MLGVACAGAILLFSASASYSQAPSYTPRFSPVLDDNINGFWEYLPRDYDLNLSVGYPLLIYIHGAGDMGSTPDLPTLQKVNRNGPPKLIAEGQFPESFKFNGAPYSFIMLAPQIKNGVTGTTSTIDPSTIDAVIEYAKRTYRVDAARIYLIGMSMGGGGTWNYAGSDIGSRKLAAIVVAAGAADLTTTEAANIDDQRIPVLATHNTVDKTVLVQRTERNIDLLNAGIQAPPAPRAVYWNTPGQKNPQETDNGEHNVWTRTFEDIYPGTTVGGNLADTLGQNAYEWMLGFSNSSNASLPLVWEGFTALKSNGQVLLQWTVSDQVNVERFVVERSVDNRNFVPLAEVASRAEGSDVSYSFLDPHPFIPQTFYRIREVDNDGQYAYSLIRKVTTFVNEGSLLRAFPNPFTDHLYLVPPTMHPQLLLVRIVDAQGQLVRARKIDYVGNAIIIDGLQALARGSYYVTLTNEQGVTLFVQKLVRQ